MGIVGKFGLDMLKDTSIDVSFKCPYCKSATIRIDEGQHLSRWKPVRCKKCRSMVVIDSFTVTVIRE